MAAKEHGFFWNSRQQDRIYSADSFSEWAKTFFTTGVFVNTNYVSAAGGLTIGVTAGYSNVDGKVGIFDEAETMTLATPHASLRRIDTVVIERNDIDREFYRKVVTGNPSATPVAPAPVRTNGIYQLVLAQITVPAGATSITQSAIKDTRADSSLCGYVAGTAKELSWEQITAQWSAYYEEFKSEQLDDFEAYKTQKFTDFDDWFNDMKDQLSTDAAGNLQLQINSLESRLDNKITAVQQLAYYNENRIIQTNYLIQNLQSETSYNTFKKIVDLIGEVESKTLPKLDDLYDYFYKNEAIRIDLLVGSNNPVRVYNFANTDKDGLIFLPYLYIGNSGDSIIEGAIGYLAIDKIQPRENYSRCITMKNGSVNLYTGLYGFGVDEYRVESTGDDFYSVMQMNMGVATNLTNGLVWILIPGRHAYEQK